jgi:hypothetical protein
MSSRLGSATQKKAAELSHDDLKKCMTWKLAVSLHAQGGTQVMLRHSAASIDQALAGYERKVLTHPSSSHLQARQISSHPAPSTRFQLARRSLVDYP